MGLLATKRTAQIMPAGVARMREEKDPAMPAPRQAAAQVGPRTQHRSHHAVVGEHQRRHDRAAAIPARPELEKLLQPDRKKANSSLRLLM
jgi:hypothetical protein